MSSEAGQVLKTLVFISEFVGFFFFFFLNPDIIVIFGIYGFL